MSARNFVVATTKFFADRWTIREYADGCYDAAENNGPGLSYGLESFDKAVEWVCEQEAARAILDHDATQAEPEPGPVAVELDEAQADLLYGMLTQRLYLRSDDPERELVSATRERLYPATSAQREYNEAHRLASEALAKSPKRRDLGPGVGGGNPHTLDIAHAEAAKREREAAEIAATVESHPVFASLSPEARETIARTEQAHREQDRRERVTRAYGYTPSVLNVPAKLWPKRESDDRDEPATPDYLSATEGVYRIEWLGPGHYRSDLYGVYKRGGELDAVGRPAQLFRGKREECEAWVTKARLHDAAHAADAAALEAARREQGRG